MSARSWIRNLSNQLSQRPAQRRTGAKRAPQRWRLDVLEGRVAPSASYLGLNNLAVDRADYATGDVLVRLRDGAVPQGLGRNIEAVAPGLYRATVHPGETVPAALANLRGRNEILFAEPDFIVRAALVPNDPSFGSLWGMDNTGQTGGIADADIDAPEAWDISTGTGQTVVAVIDSGVDYTHPDLAANIWVNSKEVAGNNLDDDGNGFIDDTRGWDFANNDNDPMDDNGHGTHVSGTIAAAGDNGVGVAGVNWHARIMPLKFLGANGSGSLSNAILAINYAVANGAKVSNNSWGSYGYSQGLFDSIKNAAAAGHIFVAAAGNSNTNTDPINFYPADYALNNIISVASTDASDARSGFSNYGSATADLAAPGSDILSTWPNNSYNTISGTSMATPHVTGAVSLLCDLNPTWTYRQVINRVLSTSDPLPALADITASGGRLNLVNSLSAPADVTAPTFTGATFRGGPTSFSSVRLSFSERVDPATLTAINVQITGPSGTLTPVGVLGVAGANGTQYDVTFPGSFTAGKYSVQVGTGVTDLAGNGLSKAGSGSGSLATAPGIIATATGLPASIPNPGWRFSDIKVGNNQKVTITDVNVRLTILHTWVGNLLIQLQGPRNGQIITLFDHHGGAGDNLNGIVFDDQATTAVASGAAPYSGAFQPTAPLSVLNGTRSDGTWTLRVQDPYGDGDLGQLVNWSLMFNVASLPAGSSSSSSASDSGNLLPPLPPGPGSQSSNTGPTWLVTDTNNDDDNDLFTPAWWTTTMLG